MCFYWVLSHMCKVCVCVFPGPDCMCMFFCASEVHVCTQSPHTFFFLLGHGATSYCPPVSRPRHCSSVRFFSFSLKLSSAVHWIRLRLPLRFLCLFRIHYPDFFPLSFLPDSQAAAVPNSLALHFFKATFKNKLITHRPLMKSC